MISIAHAMLCLLPLVASPGDGVDTQRFPPPDFDSGYEIPLITIPAPRAEFLGYLDMAVLLAALSLASYLALRKRSRRALFTLMVFSIVYFGFYREGCVCPIGAIQNVVLALFERTYALPVAVAFFFFLPLVFTLFFGRVFCAAVCPLGAIQDLALVRPVAVPSWLQQALGLMAYVYLGAAVLFAATGSAFIICEYDPFVAFFRLSGSLNMLVLGFSFLLVSLFVGRPYCRFFCPYGVILRWLSRFSMFRVTVTPDACIKCRLCEEACPFGAIEPATSEDAAPPGDRDRKRLVLLLVLLPVLVAGGGFIGSGLGPIFARMHATVRLAERIQQEEDGQVEGTTDASTAFRNTGESSSTLFEEALLIREEFVLGGWILGGFLGLAVAGRLISLSVFRRRKDYEANRAGCYACGRCFPYCPLEIERRREGGAEGAGLGVLGFQGPPGSQGSMAPEAGGTDGGTDGGIDPGDLKRRPWRGPSLGVAVVAGAFSVIVILLMVWNFASQEAGPADSISEEGLLYSPALAKTIARLAENPGDEALKKEIRRLDLEVREVYFLQRDFNRRGAYLLLAGMAILVLALKRTMVIRKNAPLPEPDPGEPDREAKELGMARRAVGVSGLVILGGALALASMGKIDLVLPSSGVPGGEGGEPLSTEDAPPPSREEIQKNWPRFRGPGGLGVSAYDHMPAAWDGASNEGILWKAEVPRPGFNSPVVWGDRVFLSGADGESKEVFCFHGDTGELLWRRTVDRVPGNRGEELEVYEDTGYAASTMACDGARVYAIFVDGDAVCFDFDGRQIWARNMGPPDNTYGYATSLTFHENNLLIQYDQGEWEDDQAVLFALDGKTGRTVWRQVRAVAGSWTSPILIDTGTQEQLITCSDPLVIAYDPATGAVLWQAELMGTDVAPSPIYANGLVFVIQPYSALYALRTDGRGDVTETHLAWTAECAAPDICSPVSNGALIFLLSSMGELACYETEGGALIWEHDFGAGFQASPSLVGEWLYLLSEEGTMHRVRAARVFEEGGVSNLGETTRASPAFADGRIYIRGDRHLFCIGNE